MKKCSKCGSVLVEGAKFCRICGEPVPQDTFEEVTLTETGIAADLAQRGFCKSFFEKFLI